MRTRLLPRLLSGRSWFLASLAVAAVAAAAAGLVIAGGRGAAAGAEPTGVVASGTFTSMAWPTTGTAAIVRRADGSVALELTNLRTHAAPELWVYLVPFRAPGGGVAGGWKIERLRSVTGAGTYTLPAKAASVANPTVVVWCSLCKKPWGAASLTRARPSRT